MLSPWTKGICVADTLKAQVFKDVFLEMNIPYSVVRGEQIQLKGTVYNYRMSGMRVSRHLWYVQINGKRKNSLILYEFYSWNDHIHTQKHKNSAQ